MGYLSPVAATAAPPASEATISDPSNKGLTYRDAGVDIDAGEALVDAIKPLAKSTARAGAAAGLGGSAPCST